MSKIKFFPIRWVVHQDMTSIYCYGRKEEGSGVNKIIVQIPFSPYITAEITESSLLSLSTCLQILDAKKIGKGNKFEITVKDRRTLKKLVKILDEGRVIHDNHISMKWKFFRREKILPAGLCIAYNLRAPIGDHYLSKEDEIHYCCSRLETSPYYKMPKNLNCLFYFRGMAMWGNGLPFSLNEEGLLKEIKTKCPDFTVTEDYHPLSTMPLINSKCSCVSDLREEWLKLFKFCNTFLCDLYDICEESEETLISNFLWDYGRVPIKKPKIIEGIFRDVYIYSLDPLYYKLLREKHGEKAIEAFKDYPSVLFYSGYYDDLTAELPRGIHWITDRLAASHNLLQNLNPLKQAKVVVIFRGSILIDEMRFGYGTLSRPPFRYLKKYVDYFMKNPPHPLPLIESEIEDFICETTLLTPELQEQCKEYKIPKGSKISYIRTVSGLVISQIWRKNPEKYYDTLDLKWYKNIINQACAIFLS